MDKPDITPIELLLASEDLQRARSLADKDNVTTSEYFRRSVSVGKIVAERHVKKLRYENTETGSTIEATPFDHERLTTQPRENAFTIQPPHDMAVDLLRLTRATRMPDLSSFVMACVDIIEPLTLYEDTSLQLLGGRGNEMLAFRRLR